MQSRAAVCLPHLRDCPHQPKNVRSRAKREHEDHNAARRNKRKMYVIACTSYLLLCDNKRHPRKREATAQVDWQSAHTPRAPVSYGQSELSPDYARVALPPSRETIYHGPFIFDQSAPFINSNNKITDTTSSTSSWQWAVFDTAGSTTSVKRSSNNEVSRGS